MKDNMKRTYPFEPKPLPYAYDSLEPLISADTLYFHHDKHYYTYVENLNKELENYPQFQKMTLEELLRLERGKPDKYEKVRRNAGGVYNHEMYFDSMLPDGSTAENSFCNELNRTFGSEEKFKIAIADMAAEMFGSGYTWLAASDDGRILLQNLKNQENPVMYHLCPLLPVDLWEHAYYLDYQNRRPDYVESWYKLVNWEVVTGRYHAMENY